MKLTKKQIGEMAARDFLGEDTWKAWKQDYDSLMSYRKSIKGKPDAIQSALLEINRPWIEFYQTALFHNGYDSECCCRSCELERKKATI